jgi:hypothetical protein
VCEREREECAGAAQHAAADAMSEFKMHAGVTH